MEKSKIYQLAQGAVLHSELSTGTKLEILRELRQREDLALFTEKNEEKAE